MRIGVRISEFFMHAWVIFLNKCLCMLIMIPGECTDPLMILSLITVGFTNSSKMLTLTKPRVQMGSMVRS